MSLLKSYKTLKEYRRDPLGFIVKLFKENGHRSHLRIFGKELFIISDPKDVLYVLKTNNSAYTKGRTTKALRQFLGNGLITNEGESWRKQHRMIRPVMNPRSVVEIATKIFSTSMDFMPELSASAQVDVLHEMNRLTWRIILRTLFSLERTKELDSWLHDILDLMRIITAKTRSSIPVPFWVPTSNHRRMKNIIRKFDEVVYGLIKERRAGGKKQDLLQLLIDSQEEGTSQMTDHEIRDEIMTFMMAGHETITNSMTWTMIELARNPHYIPRLREEVREFFHTQDYEKLNLSPWISAVVDESMRLWPPVWVFMRQAETEDKIGDWKIPPKANVVLAPFLTHRAPDLWNDPEKFFPERFLPEEKKQYAQGAFYPFGLGPRACIGAYFAGMEAKIILAVILHHYDWKLASDEPQMTEAGISLRAANNTSMSFRRI